MPAYVEPETALLNLIPPDAMTESYPKSGPKFSYIVESQRDRDTFPAPVPEGEEWDEDSCLSEEKTALAAARDAVCYAEFLPKGSYFQEEGQTLYVRDLATEEITVHHFSNADILSLATS